MNSPRFDVTAIGNAIVDVLARADDALLARHNLAKGAMSLIDGETAERLYSVMGPGTEKSGGSAGNTAAVVAGLGGRVAYIGKVADDQLGQVFTHDIRAIGVTYDTPPLKGGLPTARSLIFVTPDAQRTMQTYLGATTQLGPEDVNMDYITSSKVVYLEGYLWDQPRAKKAMRDAAIKAQQAGVKVSLTLSDAFCVARFRDEFLELAEKHVDILFANESEILSLYQVDRFDDALQRVRKHCEIAALTRSEKGSVIVNGDEVHIIDAEKGVKVVDTTGAGDAYAGGFLYGYTQGLDLVTCGRLGGLMAAEVISHLGPRPEADLKKLAASVLA
ncbi:MAG TPA: adenosine kinase [Vicinamibacterales bacterium]|jgi:sugar/nucleoside kinase (ribokinase family)|nr:adenosine kinase [Vicinamibacterales bacterium]